MKELFKKAGLVLKEQIQPTKFTKGKGLNKKIIKAFDFKFSLFNNNTEVAETSLQVETDRPLSTIKEQTEKELLENLFLQICNKAIILSEIPTDTFEDLEEEGEL